MQVKITSPRHSYLAIGIMIDFKNTFYMIIAYDGFYDRFYDEKG